MNRKEHLKVDIFFYSKKYNEVHKWIDGCFWKYMNTNPYKHWLERHHLEAIREKYEFGTTKYNIAYLHVLVDWLSHFGYAIVPETREEVEKLLIAEKII